MCVATKQRLEQELAEAVQDDGDSTGGGGDSGDSVKGEEEEEVGSGSDSEVEGEGQGDGRGGSLLSPGGMLQSVNSLEVSLWSLDVSLPGGMESSIYETEVSE